MNLESIQEKLFERKLDLMESINLKLWDFYNLTFLRFFLKNI